MGLLIGNTRGSKDGWQYVGMASRFLMVSDIYWRAFNKDHGVIAVLIAFRRSDVASLRTVAGNLDPEAVNRYHNDVYFPWQ